MLSSLTGLELRSTACPIWWDFEPTPPEMIYPGSPLAELSATDLRLAWRTHPDIGYAMSARDEMYRRGW